MEKQIWLNLKRSRHIYDLRYPDEEEHVRRVEVYLADDECDEKEWRVHNLMNRLRGAEGGLEDAEQMEERLRGWIERTYTRKERHR